MVTGLLGSPRARVVLPRHWRNRTEKRMRNCRPQTSARILFSTIAALLVASGFAVSPASAAPISFHFEATISRIDGDPTPLNLPFSLAIGQPVAATYTFGDAQTLLNIFTGAASGSHGDIAFTIGNTAGTATTNLGLINGSAGISTTVPNSSIAFAYFPLTNVFPGFNGLIAGYQANIGVSLFGNEGVVSAPTDVLRQDTWDHLTMERDLSVSFLDFNGGDFKFVTATATVTQAVVIPEPTAISTIALLMIAGGLRRGRRRSRSLDR